MTTAGRLVPGDEPAASGRLRDADAPLTDGCGLGAPCHGRSAVVIDTRTALLDGGVTRSPAGLTGSRRVERFLPRINGLCRRAQPAASGRGSRSGAGA